jgi:hypothetical protein
MMRSECYSPEFLSGFINLYKGDICLWKVKGKSYSNNSLQEEVYEQLLDCYKQYDRSATEGSVRCVTVGLCSNSGRCY